MSQITALYEARKDEHGDKKRAATDTQKILVEAIQKFDETNGKEGLNPETISIKEAFDTLVAKPYNVSLDSGMQTLIEAMTAADFPALINNVISPTFRRTFGEYQGEEMQLFNQLPTAREKFELPYWLGGMEQPRHVREAAPYEETKFSMRQLSIPLQKSGLVMKCTKEMIGEDRTGDLVGQARRVGISFGRQMSQFGIECLTCSDTSSVFPSVYQSGIEGFFKLDGTVRANSVFYSATTHSTIDGQTNINVLTGSNTGVSTWYIGDPTLNMDWYWHTRPTIEEISMGSEEAFSRDILLQIKTKAKYGAGWVDYRNIIKNVTTSLNTSNIAIAIKKLRSQTDDRGQLAPCIPRFLVVPPSLEQVALQLVRSIAEPTALNAGAANIYQGSFKVIVSPFLTEV